MTLLKKGGCPPGESCLPVLRNGKLIDQINRQDFLCAADELTAVAPRCE